MSISRARMMGWAVLGILLLIGVALMMRTPPGTSPVAPPTTGSPLRIVSLAPSVTEILFSLDVGDRVVGVTRFCNQPEAATRLPKVGGYIDPNVEAILALKPTHVVAVEEAKNENVIAQLEGLGVNVLVIDTRTLGGLREGVISLAAVVDATEQGERLNGLIDTAMEEVGARISSKDRPKVLVVLGHQPLVVAGTGIFVDELIEAAGGINVASKSAQEYPIWSIEHVIKAAPDVIVEVVMGGGGSLSWKDWQTIPAVRDGRVVTASDSDLLLRPGPRIGVGLRWLANVIHPGIFPDEKR
jgi:iron complex transport system substrate-binding protein